MKSYIHVYTGKGKGKTTAALGLALRAVGAGKRVFFAQFVKGKPYSEINVIQDQIPQIKLKQFGRGCFIVEKPEKEDIEAAQNGLKELEKIVQSGDYDLVVLDELTIALYYDLFSVEDVLSMLRNRSEYCEIVITGRNAPLELIEIADLVTEMTEVKHYYNEGVEAREGIEF